jgi:hypothetical protein
VDPADCFRGMFKIFLSASPSPLLDIWELQDHYVELWVDKKSMLDFFEPFIGKLSINIFPGRVLLIFVAVVSRIKKEIC